MNVEKVISDLYFGKGKIKVTSLGGMTNKNYLVFINNKKHVLRIPGSMTQELISRREEKYNNSLMSLSGFNANTIYFNEHSGVKLTEYLDGFESLNHNSIKNDKNIKKIAKNLYKLHNSTNEFKNTFNVFEKFSDYILLLKNKNKFFTKENNLEELYKFFLKLENSNTFNHNKLSPCHNDLVPENILTNGEKIYFIDWEYSGMNDYLFDISALFLESRMNDEEQIKFLHHYDKNLSYEDLKLNILVYQFTQDILWFLWTLIKEENNEFFGCYSKTRIKRAYETMNKIIKYKQK